MGTKKNVVLFVGAGVSVGLGIPTMASFVDKVRDLDFLDATEISLFDKILHECNQLSVAIGASARNLEHLVSFLRAFELLRPNIPLFDDVDASRATALIVRCISHVANPEILRNPLQRMMNAISSSSKSVTVATTNYDLHVEAAAIAGNIRLRPSGTVAAATTRLGGASCLSKTGTVGYYKLHGSVNWFVNPANGQVKILDDFDVTRNIDNHGIAAFRLYHQKLLGLDQWEPLILAPSVLKEYKREIIREQWTGVASALHEADQVIFCGYSFPESDIFMKYAISSSLFSNTRVRSLVVADRSPATLARAEALFSSPIHKDILTLHQTEWDRFDIASLIENGSIPADKNAAPGTINGMLGPILRDELSKRRLFPW